MKRLHRRSRGGWSGSPAKEIRRCRRWFVLTWLLCGLPSIEAAQDCSSRDRWREEAEQAVREEQLDRAATLYRQVLDCTPAWAEGWWRLGTVEYDRRQFTLAREAFEALLDRQPGYGPGELFRGMALLGERQVAEALTAIRQARSFGLGGDRRFELLAARSEATALVRLSRFDEAYAVLRLLANAEPEQRVVQELMGMAVLRLPKLPDELSEGERGLARRAGRAFVYGESGRLPDACREFEDLLSDHPELPHGHYAFGVLLLSHDPQRAVRQFELQLERDSDHLGALLQLGQELLQQEQAERARVPIERALEVEPRSPAALGLMGRLLLETGDASGAVQYLEEAVALVPESRPLYPLLARAYGLANRPEEVQRVKEIFQRLTAAAEPEAARERRPAP